MNRILNLILLAALLCGVLTQGHLKGNKTPRNENKTTVLDDNHFTSNTSREQIFTI